MTPPEDLPRSPTGRVPQWVLDQAAGRSGAPPGWQPALPPDPDHGRPGQLVPDGWRPMQPPGLSQQPGSVQPPGFPPSSRPRPPRSSPWPALLAVGVLVAGGWWYTAGMPGLPTGNPVAGLGATTLLPGDVGADAPAPGPDVVALADAAALSEEGRQLFYDARPEVLGAVAFAGRCEDGTVGRALATDGAVGCFRAGPTGTSIVLYAPADPRLHPFLVESAAHETLHAAWEQLDETERAALTPLLEAVVATLAPDDPLHEQVVASVGVHPDARPTELFAYVGTQVWSDGGLDPRLEAAYARFVVDRAALVGVHHAWQGTLDAIQAEADAASSALRDRMLAAAQQRAQLDADTAVAQQYRDSYEAQRAELDAMDPDRRERTQMSWVWWDGTELAMAPMPQTLDAAAALVARDATDLAARATALAGEEAAVAAERERVDARYGELEGLYAQLDPAP